MNVRFADRWMNGMGRSTRLLIMNLVQVWVCSECACLVIDTEKHRQWHEGLGR